MRERAKDGIWDGENLAQGRLSADDLVTRATTDDEPEARKVCGEEK